MSAKSVQKILQKTILKTGVHSTMADYYGRRLGVTKTIQRIIRGKPQVRTIPMLRQTVYVIDDSWCVTIRDQSPVPGVSMERIEGRWAPDPFADTPHALDLILASWEFERGNYCRHDHSNKPVAKACICEESQYDGDLDSGLNEIRARAYLYSQPQGHRNEIMRLVLSFEKFYYRLRGPYKPMVWPRR